jgi:putative phage-type endonuclease
MESIKVDQTKVDQTKVDQEKLKKLRARVKILQTRPQPEQRTPEWFAARHTRITASEAASTLYKSEKVCKPFVDQFGIKSFKYKDSEGLNSYETREDYIIKKCAAFYGENVFKDSVHTLWGKKYEEVANRLYCQINNTTVIEFGLLNHSKLKWLAASPDGITPDGIMLEIKCPKSRKIDETQIPIYYWVQTQIQMVTTGLDFCDFLECEIEELDDEQQFLNKEIIGGKSDKGVILEYSNEWNNERNSNQPKFVYPPISIKEASEYIEWKNSLINENPPNTFRPIYYCISKYNIQRIPRSKEWFENVKDDIKKTWDTIMFLQESRENFDKYKKSIHMIRSKNFYEKFHSTECEIHDDISTFVYESNESNNNLESNESNNNLEEVNEPNNNSEEVNEPNNNSEEVNKEVNGNNSEEVNEKVVCLID